MSQMPPPPPRHVPPPPMIAIVRYDQPIRQQPQIPPDADQNYQQFA